MPGVRIFSFVSGDALSVNFDSSPLKAPAHAPANIVRYGHHQAVLSDRPASHLRRMLVYTLRLLSNAPVVAERSVDREGPIVSYAAPHNVAGLLLTENQDSTAEPQPHISFPRFAWLGCRWEQVRHQASSRRPLLRSLPSVQSVDRICRES